MFHTGVEYLYTVLIDDKERKMYNEILQAERSAERQLKEHIQVFN